MIIKNAMPGDSFAMMVLILKYKKKLSNHHFDDLIFIMCDMQMMVSPLHILTQIYICYVQ